MTTPRAEAVALTEEDRHFPDDGCIGVLRTTPAHQLGVIRYRHPNIEGPDPFDGQPQRMCALDRQAWPCETIQAIDLAALLADRGEPEPPSEGLREAAHEVIDSADTHEVGLPSDASLDALRVALAAPAPEPASEGLRAAALAVKAEHDAEGHREPCGICAALAALGKEGLT